MRFLLLNVCENEFFETSLTINKFNLKLINKSPSKFDYNKLDFINSHYLSISKNENILENLLIHNHKLSNYDEKYLEKIINIYKLRSNDEELVFMMQEKMQKNA